MVLPLIKLAFLAVKQVSKPVANRIKDNAITNERLHGAMVWVGQRLHYNMIQVNRIADGLGALKSERVGLLKEKEALVRGADFLAEMVVYSVSAGVLGAEYWLSEQKAKKAAAAAAAKEAEALRLKELNEKQQWREFEQLNCKLEEAQRRLSAMEEMMARQRRWW